MADMARNRDLSAVALRSDRSLMARQFKPDAIMLDIRLPGMDGWTVLDRLKHDPNITSRFMIQSSWATAQSATGASRICKKSPVRH